MRAVSLAGLVLVVAATVAPAARADELAALLSAGPLVRIETDLAGKYKEGLAIADVDAPADVVWQVLTDFSGYKGFMPRVSKCDVERDGADYLLDMKLDTPFVSTRYTNRAVVDDAARTIKIKQEKGDLKGSRYHWRVVPLADGKRTRVYYGGIVRNFSSVAESMEDDQQTITIGINVVTLMATVKAVKQRSELVAKSAPAG